MPTVTLQSKYLEDAQGNKYAPITTPNAVRWSNGDDLDDKLAAKQAVIDSSNKLPASNVSGLATVATSGSYNDLSNKPTTMGASGSGHASGLVPDPGSTAGTSKYLREDGTWAEPSGGGGGGLPTGVSTVFSLANIPTTVNVVVADISSNQSTVSIYGISWNSGSPTFGNFTDGKELHVLVIPNGSVTITLPTALPYILCGDDSALTVGVGEIAEINFISCASQSGIYVKAVKSAMTYTLPT